MEETNFSRAITAPMTDEGPIQPQSDKATPHSADEEKSVNVATDIEHGTILAPSKKTYPEKLQILRKEDLRNKVPLMNMVKRTFVYFSLPVVVFSGFMYGAVVCYFNILNATASLILSGAPYHFSASMVGVSYVACLIGVGLG